MPLFNRGRRPPKVRRRFLLPALGLFLFITACGPGSGIVRPVPWSNDFDVLIRATERLIEDIRILEERIDRLEEQRFAEALETGNPVLHLHEKAIDRLNAAVEKILDTLDLMLREAGTDQERTE
jgi:hypothetical protein